MVVVIAKNLLVNTSSGCKWPTHILIPGALKHRSNYRGRIVGTPPWLCRGRSRVVLQQVQQRTWGFSTFTGLVEQVHLIIFISNLVRQTTCPCLYFVHLVSLLIISRFADIYFLSRTKATRSPSAKASDKHDEAPVNDLVNSMISILTRLDNLFRKKVLFELMDRLLGSVVPASVDPIFAVAVLPGTIDLSNDRFRHIVGILDVYPISDLP